VVHYRMHNSSPQVSVMWQTKPVLILVRVYYLFKVHLILSFLPRHDARSEYIFFSSLLDQNAIRIFNSPIQAKCPTNIYFYKTKSICVIIWSNYEFRFLSGLLRSISSHLADKCLNLLAFFPAYFGLSVATWRINA
jgi:hypothetical protein